MNFGTIAGTNGTPGKWPLALSSGRQSIPGWICALRAAVAIERMRLPGRPRTNFYRLSLVQNFIIPGEPRPVIGGFASQRLVMPTDCCDGKNLTCLKSASKVFMRFMSLEKRH